MIPYNDSTVRIISLMVSLIKIEQAVTAYRRLQLRRG